MDGTQTYEGYRGDGEIRVMNSSSIAFITLCLTGTGCGGHVPASLSFPHVYGHQWKCLLVGILGFLHQDLEDGTSEILGGVCQEPAPGGGGSSDPPPPGKPEKSWPIVRKIKEATRPKCLGTTDPVYKLPLES